MANFNVFHGVAASIVALAACAVPPSSPTTTAGTALPQDDGFRDRVANIVASRHAAPSGAFCANGLFRCFARGKTDAQGQRIHGTPDVDAIPGFGATDLEAAYAIPVATDPHATVAIVDAYGYSALESDLAMYRSQYNLPECTIANDCLKIVDQTGGNNLPDDNSDWIGETSLDVDMVSAACPKCKILVVQATDDSSDGLFVSIKTAATLGATVISNSWGAPEDEIQDAFDVSVTQAETYLNHPGIGVFVATGDDGYNDDEQGPDYPGTSGYSIGVGGTSLTQDASSRGWSETAWDDGGSACSESIAMPAWQTGTSNCTTRMTADVSSVGDPDTGVAVYDSDDGGWEQVGGTSAASPLTAAIFALTGNGTRTAQFAYQHPTAFYDVTSGTDGDCGAKLCTAGTGWDGPTGNGTPNGTMLAALGSDGSGSGMGSGSGSGSNGSGSAGSGSNGSGSGSDDGNGDNDGNGNGNGNGGGGGGCAAAGGSSTATILFALGLAFVRRRRHV